MSVQRTARASGYAVALDVGGTFTDVALVHEATGRLWATAPQTAVFTAAARR